MAYPSSSFVDRRRGIRAFALASMALGLGLLVLVAPSAQAKQDEEHKVVLCHATSSDVHPYEDIEVDVSSAQFEGHDGHDGGLWFEGHEQHYEWGDIIPAFEVGEVSYPGKNWPAGEAIWANGCELPGATTTSTTAEATTTSTTLAEETTTSTTEPPTTTSTMVEEVTTTSTSTTVEEATTTSTTDEVTTTEASTTQPTLILNEALTAPDGLPKTGAEPGGIALAGGALLALGVGLLLWQRQAAAG